MTNSMEPLQSNATVDEDTTLNKNYEMEKNEAVLLCTSLLDFKSRESSFSDSESVGAE